MTAPASALNTLLTLKRFETVRPDAEYLQEVMDTANSLEHLDECGVDLDETLVGEDALQDIPRQELAYVQDCLAQADALRDAFHEATVAALSDAIGPRFWNHAALTDRITGAPRRPRVVLWAEFDSQANLAICAGTRHVDSDEVLHESDVQDFAPAMQRHLKNGIVLLSLDAQMYPQDISVGTEGACAPAACETARALTRGLQQLLQTLETLLDVQVSDWPGYDMEGEFEVRSPRDRTLDLLEDVCAASEIKEIDCQANFEAAAAPFEFASLEELRQSIAECQGDEAKLEEALRARAKRKFSQDRLQALAQATVLLVTACAVRQRYERVYQRLLVEAGLSV